MGRLFWGGDSSLCFFSVNKPEGQESGRLIQRLFHGGVGGIELSIAAFQRVCCGPGDDGEDRDLDKMVANGDGEKKWIWGSCGYGINILMLV